MREIIFRGKRKYIDGTIGEWVYGSLSVMSGGEHAFIIDHKADYIYEVEPATVGQYTGLEDCAGMWIYEGDILASDEYGVTAIVEWKGDRFIAKFENGDEVALANIARYCRVIGNIHDKEG